MSWSYKEIRFETEHAHHGCRNPKGYRGVLFACPRIRTADVGLWRESRLLHHIITSVFGVFCAGLYILYLPDVFMNGYPAEDFQFCRIRAYVYE